MEGLSLLPLLVALPLGAAFVVALVGDRVRAAGAGLSLLVTGALLAGAVALLGQEGIHSVGGWPTPHGIDLRIDGLGTLMLLLIAAVGLATAIYSMGWLEQERGPARYYALLLLMIAGMNGVASAGDLFNLYVFVEIASMAAYASIAYGGRPRQLEGAFKYAVLGGIASTFIFLGIGVLYGLTGTLNMAHLGQRLADPAIMAGHEPIGTLAAALLLVGFGLKAALVPFHAWLPDAYPAAPAPISALLSGVMSKVLGAYVLARLVFDILGPSDDLLALLRMLGVASMVVGGLAALGQRDVKRLFAYSSVEQMGYIVLALGLGTSLGAVAAVFHMLNHAAFKTLMFLNAGVVERATGTRQLPELGGLARRMPGTCAVSLVGALSNAGLPPFGGFWSKLVLVIACVDAGAPGLAAVAVIISVITLAFQLRVQQQVFFGAAAEPVPALRPVPLAMHLPGWALALVCAALGLLCVQGLSRPLLVGPAADALTAGRLGRGAATAATREAR